MQLTGSHVAFTVPPDSPAQAHSGSTLSPHRATREPRPRVAERPPAPVSPRFAAKPGKPGLR
jgi:hypothetical protein